MCPARRRDRGPGDRPAGRAVRPDRVLADHHPVRVPAAAARGHQGAAQDHSRLAAGPRPAAHGLHRPDPGRLPGHQRPGTPELTSEALACPFHPIGVMPLRAGRRIVVEVRDRGQGWGGQRLRAPREYRDRRRSGMNSLQKPSVLFVFYTHTQQSLRVAEAMAGVLRERGCEVSLAGIEFTDPHYARKFGRFPFRHAVFDLLTVLPAQTRRATGQIRIPEAAREADYDRVCFGSPTWFFTTSMPLRSYLKSAEVGKVLAGKRVAASATCP